MPLNVFTLCCVFLGGLRMGLHPTNSFDKVLYSICSTAFSQTALTQKIPSANLRFHLLKVPAPSTSSSQKCGPVSTLEWDDWPPSSTGLASSIQSSSYPVIQSSIHPTSQPFVQRSSSSREKERKSKWKEPLSVDSFNILLLLLLRTTFLKTTHTRTWICCRYKIG